MNNEEEGRAIPAGVVMVTTLHVSMREDFRRELEAEAKRLGLEITSLARSFIARGLREQRRRRERGR